VAEAEGTSGWKDAQNAGFKVSSATDVAREADIIMMLAPDTVQSTIYRLIEKELVPGNTLMFAHGFNIHYGQITPPMGIDVTMIAPKGPGHLVRQLYVDKIGIPALVAVYQDASRHPGIGGGLSGCFR